METFQKNRYFVSLDKELDGNIIIKCINSENKSELYEKKFSDVNITKAEALINNAKKSGKEYLSAAELYELLSLYGIPVAGWGTAKSAEEAEKTASKIGYPVVVKADAESIVHKSDMGGVAVNLADANALKAAVSKMKEKFGTVPDLKFFIQKFLPGGREVIVGAKSEGELGHLVLFGLGGIYVEVLKDVSFGITPITGYEADKMISSIKTSKLLTGYRGQKPVDQKILAEILQRVSQLVSDIPAIQEMDLNPIMAFEDKALVVDARIKI